MLLPIRPCFLILSLALANDLVEILRRHRIEQPGCVVYSLPERGLLPSGCIRLVSEEVHYSLHACSHVVERPFDQVLGSLPQSIGGICRAMT
jgi:hypothetical protein